MKKLLALFLTLTMVILLLPSALAEGDDSFASVKEFLCAPSPYTNGDAYGKNIDGTLTQSGTTVSLGTAGGYVIYEFKEPIKNSKANPYGIDFKIVGNSFNGAYTTQEPGQVWVSQDGENWYALAGSEHYEDSTVWDYSITYKNSTDGVIPFTDNCAHEGELRGNYPLAENYPTVSFSDDELTLGGILLRYERNESTANGIVTSFGYADALKADKTDALKNPYCENPATNGIDGEFDLDWAVDSEGYPVALSRAKYVKVQSATLINGGAFGEKSTELSKVILIDENEAAEATTADYDIEVNGKAVELSSDKVIYDVSELAGDSGFEISVDADGANVYINNLYGTSRTFDSAPAKGIVRVIIQQGESAPTVYYLKTNKGGEMPSEPYVPDTDLEHIVGESMTVSFSYSAGEVVIPKQTITVDDGLGEKYGYEVAKKDHNGERIDGVSVFDIIVAAHKAYYGDAFTPETAENYLIMSDSFITKAFGVGTSVVGFLVNYSMPNDGIINPLYGTYTCYSCDTAKVKDGDFVSFYLYQDKSYWSDNATYFDKDNFSASAGEEVTLNISTYCAMYYGACESNVIAQHTLPAAGAEVWYYDENNQPVLLGYADENGNITVSFDKPGSYKLFTGGTVNDEYGYECPVIPGWCEAEITESQSEPSCWDKIIGFLKSVFDWIVNLFIKVLDFIKNIY